MRCGATLLSLGFSFGLAATGCSGDDGDDSGGSTSGATDPTSSTSDGTGTGGSGSTAATDGGSGGSGGGSTGGQVVTFEVVIENVSTPFSTSMGDVDLKFAPGVWAIHGEVEPMFTPGAADRGEGLEPLAEDGDPSTLGAALGGVTGVTDSDVFDLPEGDYEAGAILPGESFKFEVTASPGDRLSFAGMFAESNDIFLAPGSMGIALFDGMGAPVSGDQTAALTLWDAGTEVNEEPGVGPNQAPRQTGPDTGMDENGVVQAIGDVGDGFTYPTVAEFVSLTITPMG